MKDKIKALEMIAEDVRNDAINFTETVTWQQHRQTKLH
jgi:hypothetical protein